MKEEIKINIDMKDYKPPRKTLWHFFWYFVNLYKESESMFGYMRENWNVCEDMQKLPSKKILKRYNIKYDQSNLFLWWLLEQYFEGNLIKKEDVQPKQ